MWLVTRRARDVELAPCDFEGPARPVQAGLTVCAVTEPSGRSSADRWVNVTSDDGVCAKLGETHP